MKSIQELIFQKGRGRQTTKTNIIRSKEEKINHTVHQEVPVEYYLLSLGRAVSMDSPETAPAKLGQVLRCDNVEETKKKKRKEKNEYCSFCSFQYGLSHKMFFPYDVTSARSNKPIAGHRGKMHLCTDVHTFIFIPYLSRRKW